MAIMCQNGLARAQNDDDAFKWMKQAADQGHALAQHGIGFMYLQGECVDKNESEAVKWFTAAAEQGLPGSQMTLGMMYEQGQGVEQNAELERLAEGVEQDAEAAQKWYKLAEANS